MTCRTCGAAIPDDAARCPHCGAQFRPVAERSRPVITAAGAPPVITPRPAKPVGMGTYFLWWTVALFSNAEIVCMILSVVFIFDSGNRNRANFFRAVLLFKLILLFLGMVAVIVLAMSGFSFTDLLNRVGPRALWDFFREVF